MGGFADHSPVSTASMAAQGARGLRLLEALGLQGPGA